MIWRSSLKGYHINPLLSHDKYFVSWVSLAFYFIIFFAVLKYINYYYWFCISYIKVRISFLILRLNKYVPICLVMFFIFILVFIWKWIILYIWYEIYFIFIYLFYFITCCLVDPKVFIKMLYLFLTNIGSRFYHILNS